MIFTNHRALKRMTTDVTAQRILHMLGGDRRTDSSSGDNAGESHR